MGPVFRRIGRFFKGLITLTFLSAIIGGLFFALDRVFLKDAERPPRDAE